VDVSIFVFCLPLTSHKLNLEQQYNHYKKQHYFNSNGLAIHFTLHNISHLQPLDADYATFQHYLYYGNTSNQAAFKKTADEQ
jgi:hypothetical protein